MAGREVERGMRAAYRSLSVPDGGSSPMPSQSQGAERRPERRAGLTGSRWVLRALVIGGLAGVAWLLTGTAANAADHGDEPIGSFLGSTMDVTSVYGDEPLVGELREAAAQPLEFESAPAKHQERKAHRHHDVVTSIVTAVDRALSEPVVLLDEAMRDGSAIDAELIGDQWRRPAVPPRTSGAEPDDRTRQEPVGDAADPGAELVPADLPPVVPAPVSTTVPAAGPVVTERPAAAGRPRVAGDTARPASAGHSKRPRASSGGTPARHVKAKSRSHIAGKFRPRHVPAVEPAAPETTREEAPGDDRPAPMRMSLGAVSGIPAGGPGASPEFGSVAVLPARIANGVVDDHQFPLASDVDVRRHDAEAPTVSPD